MKKDILSELKSRKIFNNISSEEKFNSLNLKNGIGVYTGFDPTADSLHLGNYIQIITLQRFKQFSFIPYAIIGGITGMIGDPSFRKTERQFLEEDVLISNKLKIKKQLESFGLKVIDNYDFYKNWTLVDFLRKIGKLINVNYLLEKDSIKTRINNGLTYTEFTYQLFQAWDFKTLFKENNVKIQLGGSDQWGNITTGLEIIRKVHGEEADAIGITANLLLNEQGEKFGKSTGGGSLWLDSKKTSPYSIYQFLLNQSDKKVNELLLWLTFIEVSEIEEIIKKHNEAKHLRYAQKTLAYEVVKNIHNKQTADKCEKISNILFSKDSNLILNLDLDEISLLKGFLPVFKVKANDTITNVLKNNNILSSNREVREFIGNSAILLDGKVIKSPEDKIVFENFDKNYAILRKGKKDFFILQKISK
ncbi:tyrosine--tRNA ligase [Metamycoplasma hyosynoviae]|uniref:tyrosine--tRNA ligase n=1 Tax=Metamycoplasma hyosynoviae TaxID=29559 RepID=UPI002365D93F|nr:tyrosine--tRNA ligase [Metamycoplasma hyosynoviae]MDD7837618.1 tyrosine--tRNA ligase [Metamycoplasma hyosynoviae]